MMNENKCFEVSKRIMWCSCICHNKGFPYCFNCFGKHKIKKEDK